MFGHDDKDVKKEDNVSGDGGAVVQPIPASPDDSLVGVGPAATATQPVASTTVADGDEDISKIVDDINATTDAGDERADTPAAPKVEPTAAPTVEPEPETEPKEDPAAEPTLQETPTELLEVKKSALQELSPLLDELDQPPDEKLNILMMTIQATDDQTLLPQALETAKKIEDKKARAEAMLDIIQEINYFTKKQ